METLVQIIHQPLYNKQHQLPLFRSLAVIGWDPVSPVSAPCRDSSTINNVAKHTTLNGHKALHRRLQAMRIGISTRRTCTEEIPNCSRVTAYCGAHYGRSCQATPLSAFVVGVARTRIIQGVKKFLKSS